MASRPPSASASAAWSSSPIPRPGTSPSAAAGWWNRDVMAHLAAGDTAAAQLVAGERADELEEYRGRSSATRRSRSTAFNAWTVARRSGARHERGAQDLGPRRATRSSPTAPSSTTRTGRCERYPWLAGDIAARYLVQSRDRRVVPARRGHARHERRGGAGSYGGSTGRSTSRSTWPCGCCPGRCAQAGHDLSGHDRPGRRRRRRRGLVALGAGRRRGRPPRPKSPTR